MAFFRSAQTSWAPLGGATTLTALKPSGLQNGDVLIAFISADGSGATFTPPSGWTLLNDNPQNSPDGQHIATYGFNTAITGSEPASWNWTLSAAVSAGITLVGIGGAGSLTFQVATSNDGAQNASPITVSGPGLAGGSSGFTSSSNDCLIFFVATDQGTASGIRTQWSASSWPDQFTERVDSSVDWTSLAVATRDGVPAGINTNTFTVSLKQEYGATSWAGWSTAVVRVAGTALTTGTAFDGASFDTTAFSATFSGSTASVSGVSSSAAAGILSAAVDDSVQGLQAATAVGSAVDAVQYSPLGQSSSGAIGAVSGSSATSIALSGQAGSAATGSVAGVIAEGVLGQSASGLINSASGDLSSALSGQASSGFVGSVAENQSLGISGQSSTGAQGATGPVLSASVFGLSAAAAVGAVAILNDVTKSVAGVSATGSSGAIANAANDPYLSNVKLLLHGIGVNGSTAFVDNSSVAATPTVVGAAAISTAQSIFGQGSSIQPSTGNATAGYLTYASSTNYGLGTGAFTFETWVYIPANPSGPVALFDMRPLGSPSAAMPVLALDGASRVFFALGTTSQISYVTSLALNTWHHIAVTRSNTAGQTRLWIDGVQGGTSANVSTDFGTSASVTVGGDWVNGSQSGTKFFSGYLSEYRLTVGVERYTGAFSLPAAPFQNFSNDKTLAVSGLSATGNVGVVSVPSFSFALSGTQASSGFSSLGPVSSVSVQGALGVANVGLVKSDVSSASSISSLSATGGVGAAIAIGAYGISGNSSSAVVGSTARAQTSSALGVAASGVSGALSSVSVSAVSGVSVAGSAGAVNILQQGSSVLLGNSVTGTVGSPAVSFTKGISGQTGAGSVGAIAQSKLLSGNQATGTSGSVSEQISNAALGNAASGSVGTLSAVTDKIVAVSGVVATSSVGLVGFARPISGVSAASFNGFVQKFLANQAAIPGVSAYGYAGQFVPIKWAANSSVYQSTVTITARTVYVPAYLKTATVAAYGNKVIVPQQTTSVKAAA